MKYSQQTPLLPYDLLLSFLRVTGSSKNLLGVTLQVVSSFLVAHDVNQLQVFPGEQHAVEVVQVDVNALVIL